jgi:Raf kinase inhibitor-like YbhB/YbcL family protein
MNKGFQLTSKDFPSGAAIPRQHTCQGPDESPELHWGEAPAGTASLALIVDDPDAPAGVWVHWVAWNIPAAEHGTAANFPRQEQAANGARQGRNDFGKIGYNGPCPPPGKTHRYFFRLYALDTRLDLQAGATRAQLDAAMQGHILAKTEYMGTFKR